MPLIGNTQELSQVDRVRIGLEQAFPEMRDIDEKILLLPKTVKMRILDLLCTGDFDQEGGMKHMEGYPIEEIRAIYTNHLRHPNG